MTHAGIGIDRRGPRTAELYRLPAPALRGICPGCPWRRKCRRRFRRFQGFGPHFSGQEARPESCKGIIVMTIPVLIKHISDYVFYIVCDMIYVTYNLFCTLYIYIYLFIFHIYITPSTIHVLYTFRYMYAYYVCIYTYTVFSRPIEYV